MDAIILVLCIALTVVLTVTLVCGSIRVIGNYRELQEELAKGEEEPEQVIVVKQKAGEVRVSYRVAPNGELAEEAAVAVAEPVTQPAAARDGVLIPLTEKLTFPQKLDRLSAENRSYLDEFVAYVTEKQDCDRLDLASGIMFRYKKGHIAKATIRREVVVLGFPIVNPELGRMVREEKLKGVIMQAAEIRLTNAEELALAKQTADITIHYLKEEEE